MAIGDDRLAGLEPAAITVSAAAVRHDDVAQLHRLIRLHDEHERPLLTSLHGRVETTVAFFSVASSTVTLRTGPATRGDRGSRTCPSP